MGWGNTPGRFFGFAVAYFVSGSDASVSRLLDIFRCCVDRLIPRWGLFFLVLVLECCHWLALVMEVILFGTGCLIPDKECLTIAVHVQQWSLIP